LRLSQPNIRHDPNALRVVRFSTLQYRKYVSDGDPAAEEYRSRPPAMHGVDTTQRYRLFLLTYPGTVASRNVASRRRCYAMSDFDEAIDKENLDLAAIADECRKEAGDDIGRAADIMTERVKKSDPLYRLLHDPLTRNACYDWLRKSFELAEQPSGPTPVQSAAEQAARAKARAEATGRAMASLKLRVRVSQ